MRKMMMLALMAVLAVPAMAEDRPTMKISGDFPLNGMAGVLPLDQYSYSRVNGSSSKVSLDRNASRPWGCSLEWSPDGRGLWLELGLQKAPEVKASFDTTARRKDKLTVADVQSNNHAITIYDVTLGVKGDITPDSRYVSVLIGAGVHYRRLWDDNEILTYQLSSCIYPGGCYGQVEPKLVETVRHQQTRLYASLGLELYPAGRERHIALGLSARALGDGEREQQFLTDTLLDKRVVIGIQPGWYDVTARLLLRF